MQGRWDPCAYICIYTWISFWETLYINNKEINEGKIQSYLYPIVYINGSITQEVRI